MPAPLLSIIVVCKNPGPRLATALTSVWRQRPSAPELIVIDGGSTDGSREWLQRESARITVLISEPDEGVYAAMNKGWAAARGEWVLFLGADDQLEHETVLSEALVELERTDAGIAIGEAAYADGRVYRFDPNANPVVRNFIHHQAAFYRRPLLMDHSGFNASFVIMADYDLNLRLRRSGVGFAPLPVRVATCGTRGLSDSGRWRGYREEIAARHLYFPAWQCWLWDTLSVVRYLRKQVILRLPQRHG